jgi:phospholipase C
MASTAAAGPHAHRPMRRVLLIVIASAAFAACDATSADDATRSTRSTPTDTPAAPTQVASAPKVDAASIPTRWPIKHVVFLIKENRTFDNLFGTFPGANGTSVGTDHGHPRPLIRGTDARVPGDIQHCYVCSRVAWHAGAMDLFDQGLYGDWAYTQLHRDQLPNYWRWARRNVLFDNVFASAWGPSFPNHLYTIAAQSGGARDNPRRKRIISNTFGCDAPPQQLVEVYDSEGKVVKVPPCFDFLTEGDLLRKAHVPWVYYAATESQRGYIWSAYSAIRRYRQHRALWQRRIRPVDGLLSDIREGRLPPITWITPRFELSEHPEFSFCHGENWSTQVIDAIMRSPMWKDTAIFLTWDDYGGFYDHVPPPDIDRMGFGFRVPMLLISPYSKRGFVSHELGEFSSVLRFIEDNWRLGRKLTSRDREATPLLSAFDFARSPRAPDPAPLRTNCTGPRFPKE